MRHIAIQSASDTSLKSDIDKYKHILLFVFQTLSFQNRCYLNNVLRILNILLSNAAENGVEDLLAE